MSAQRPLFLDIGPGLSVMVGLPVVVSWNNKSRPKNAKTGTLGFNTQTKSLEYWNGSHWLTAKMG